MAQTNVLLTYGDNAIREDVVLNAIEILTARETQISTMLGKTQAIAMVHSFLTDTLATAASAAVEQGQDYSYGALTTPTRLTNLVEEIAFPIRVTRPEQVVQHYHGENELQRQLNKAMLQWGNSLEFDLVRSTLASGASGTAQTMAGIIVATSLANNHTSQTSGTVWSSSILDAYMLNCWTTSNGDVADNIFMGGILRRNTDNFVQKSNVVVNTPTDIGDIIRTVTRYETAFGTLDIHKHRYVQQGGDATGRVLAIRTEKLKLAFLDKPYIQTDLSTAGPYTPRAVYGSVTLEVRNQNSCFFSDGFLLA